MSTREKLINARLGMLALAEELQNISQACQRAEISRSHYYEIKEAFERYGPEGLAPRRLLRMYYGREYCGRPLQHPYELYLAISQIQHRRTQVGSPQTNGFCERFHRTLKEEFFAVAFRKTEYESLDQLLVDLDRYLAFYNRERAHQGYRTKGRTPYQAFVDGVAAMQQTEEVEPEAA